MHVKSVFGNWISVDVGFDLIEESVDFNFLKSPWLNDKPISTVFEVSSHLL